MTLRHRSATCDPAPVEAALDALADGTGRVLAGGQGLISAINQGQGAAGPSGGSQHGSPSWASSSTPRTASGSARWSGSRRCGSRPFCGIAHRCCGPRCAARVGGGADPREGRSMTDSSPLRARVNGETVDDDVSPPVLAGRLPPRRPRPGRHPHRLRARHLRGVHRAGRRRAGAGLPDAGRAGRRRHGDDRGLPAREDPRSV